MDRKILTVSIMTILVLLGVSWVIAGVIVGGISPSYGVTNMSTNGTVNNWSKGSTNYYENLTFEFKLNHNGSFCTYNITNITIRPHNSNSTDTTTFDIGNLTIESGLNSTMTFGPKQDSSSLDCKVLSDKLTIQCLNTTDAAGSNATGNGTFMIWAMVNANNTGIENVYKWNIEVTDNRTDTSSITYDYWGIDGLAPRLIELNISDDTNTWSTSDGTLDGSSAHTISNDSDIRITFRINESNRADGKIMIFWNDTSELNFVNLSGYSGVIDDHTGAGGGQYNVSGNSSCDQFEDTSVSTQACTYDLFLNKGNFTGVSDNGMITFTIFTNDSYNHTSFFNRYNISIDTSNPVAKASVSKDQTTYSLGEVTVSCTGDDDTSDVVITDIVLIKPDGEIITVKDKVSYVFRNTDTGSAGKYKTYCKLRDVVGRTAESAKEEFTIYYRTHHTATGATPSKIADVDISTTSAPSGGINGKQGESETFTLDGVIAHRLTFLEIGIDSAKMQIESDPIEFTLSIGESKEITLDEETLKITLDSIINGKASVTVTNVVKEAEAIEEAKRAAEDIAEKAGISTWLIVLIIVVILVVVFFVIKGRKGKKGEVKFSRKDLV